MGNKCPRSVKTQGKVSGGTYPGETCPKLVEVYVVCRQIHFPSVEQSTISALRGSLVEVNGLIGWTLSTSIIIPSLQLQRFLSLHYEHVYSSERQKENMYNSNSQTHTTRYEFT